MTESKVEAARAEHVEAINDAIRKRLPGTPTSVRAEAAQACSDTLDDLIAAAIAEGRREALVDAERVVASRDYRLSHQDAATVDSVRESVCADLRALERRDAREAAK